MGLCKAGPEKQVDPVVLAVLEARGAFGPDKPFCFLEKYHSGRHMFKSVHDQPFGGCVRDAIKLIKSDPKLAVWQKWTCANCGARQTMVAENLFYETGTCEECQAVTDIKLAGCNYIMIRALGGTVDQFKKVVRDLGGSSNDDTRSDA